MFRKPTNANWRDGLLRDMRDPKKQLLRNDLAVVIADKFPRSKHHYLVLPFEEIDTIYELQPHHVSLLETMQELGVQRIKQLTGVSVADFRFGFHMGAKLHRLHLHVISQDFVSDRLRKAEQWNGYNTAYFMPFEDILRELKENGKIRTRPRALIEKLLLQAPLVCNQCPDRFDTLLGLKGHLETHWVEKSLQKITIV